MELKFNPEQTNSCNKNPIYVQYKKWLQQNGVQVDSRICYPSYFGQKNKGVIGISASKPIQKGKVVISVPYNLIITMQKVLNVQIICKIVKQNNDIFGFDKDHAVMKILILYVCYELLKGQKSYYYPYFQIAQDYCLDTWNNMELTTLQDKILMHSMKKYKQQVSKYFLQFLRIFTKYDDAFPSDKGNIFYQKLFDRAYNFVTTRAFGWSLPSISLIPMADSLNHGNNYLNHFMINTQEQKKPSQTYLCRKQKVNLSLLNKQHLNPSQNLLNQLRKKKKRRYQKFIQKHIQILKSAKDLSGQLSGSSTKIQTSNQRNKQYLILAEQYKSQVRSLRQLHFYETSCSQDNDTDQDQISEFVIKRQKFQFDEKYSKIKSSSQIKDKNNLNKKSIKKITKDYWKLWYDNNLQEQNQQQQQQKQQIKSQENATSKKQLLENYSLKHKESEGSSLVSSSQTQQDDQDFTWMKNHQPNNYQNCYFVMQTRKVYRENQQLHNFYGRRPNRYLLQSYNFVMAENQYDSYSFRMIIDDSLNSKVSADKLIYTGNKVKKSNVLTREIRLKKQRINIQLINHCRCYTLQFQKKQFPNPTLTIPFDREIQIKTLKFYKEIIQSLQNKYITSIDEDYEMLQKTIKHQLKTAIIYKILQKQILNNQKMLIDKCIDFLNKKWKNGRIQKPTWKDIKLIKQLKQYVKSLQRGNVQ